jgi:hypothetical protein
MPVRAPGEPVADKFGLVARGIVHLMPISA